MNNYQLTTIAPQFRLDATIAMAGMSQHTQRSYVRWIERYFGDATQASINLSVLDVELTLSVLKPAYLRIWLGKLKESGLKKQSVTQAKSAVCWLAHFLSDAVCLDYNIAAGMSAVKLPRMEDSPRSGTWLSQEESVRLLNFIRQAKTPGSVRDASAIALMLVCGLRCEEVAVSSWGDLKLQGSNATLLVHGKGKKLRTVKLPPVVLEILGAWRLYHPNPRPSTQIITRILKHGRVLEKRVSPHSIYNIVTSTAQKLALPPLAPHDLRRTFARGAYEIGVSIELIRQSLGHSTIAMTEHYINAKLELDRSATDLWADFLTGGGHE